VVENAAIPTRHRGSHRDGDRVRFIEFISIVGDLTQTLPVLAAVPGKSELGRFARLLTISRRLADTPMSAIGAQPGDYGYPAEVARELLTTNVD
jgi:hypothetical protein